MKLFIVVISVLVLFPSLSWAKKIRIDSKLYFAGKKIGSPRVMGTIGKKSKMFVKDSKSNRDYKLEVTTKRLDKENMILNYNLSIRENNNEILTRGSIKIANGSSGRVYIDKKKAEIHFKIKEITQ